MALLDGFANALYQFRADALLLESGNPISLVSGVERRPITQYSPTGEQVVDLIAEIAPTNVLDEMTRTSHVTFQYDSPSGPVTIDVRHDAQYVRVHVVPTPPSFREPAPRSAAAPTSDSSPWIAPSPSSAPPPSPAPRPVIPVAPPPPVVAVAAVAAAVAPAAPAPVPAKVRKGSPGIEQLFVTMVRERCSDLHLTAGNPVMFRRDGDIIATGEPLPAARVDALIREILPERNREEFDARHDTDFAYEIPGVARIRCNVFLDRTGTGGVFRTIPATIITAEDLGLAPAILEMCELEKGLIVVTGPTGSGKSTTLAAMIDYINRRESGHIITIEDPIEFVHPNKKCLVNQREVGVHTDGFKSALRAALREDPDIVLVGEMRDLETVAIAIETAETGHLVFGTLHTNTAASTVDRMIDQFPSDRQQQIRTMLSESLKGVVSQVLIKKKGGGRIAAHEILPVTPSVSNLIREAKTFQITSVMQAGKGVGMVTMTDAILDLVRKKVVTPEEAYAKSPAKGEMRAALSKLGIVLAG